MNDEPNSLVMPAVHLLNFGCGTVFHPAWTNLDTSPASPEVLAHDLRKGFPFPADTFDGVYGSHVLEHLDVGTAQALLHECYRVLKPGGTLRLVVPDLESIARLYISSLDGALAGDAEAKLRYDWIMLELFDQTVRTSPGGRMADCMCNAESKEQSEFIASRVGAEALPCRQGSSRNAAVLWHAMRRSASMLRKLRQTVASVCAFVMLGPKGRSALREGLFRQSGEVHQWMYDRFSLARALAETGFLDIRVSEAGRSGISGFAGYGLELLDGRERKPDSLYMEARKPLRP